MATAPLRLAHRVFRLPSSAATSVAGVAPVRRPLVVLLHGLFGSKNNWNSFAPRLGTALQCDVATLDLRNHGDSPHAPEMTYCHMAADVVATMQALANPTVAEQKDRKEKEEAAVSLFQHPPSLVIGHSMGAKVAYAMSLMYGPAQVPALVGIDLPPWRVEIPPSFKTFIGAMLRVENQPCDSMKMANKLLTEAGIEDPKIRAFLLTNSVITSNLEKSEQNSQSSVKNSSGATTHGMEEAGYSEKNDILNTPPGGALLPQNQPYQSASKMGFYKTAIGSSSDVPPGVLKNQSVLKFRIPLQILGDNLVNICNFPNFNTAILQQRPASSLFSDPDSKETVDFSAGFLDYLGSKGVSSSDDGKSQACNQVSAHDNGDFFFGGPACVIGATRGNYVSAKDKPRLRRVFPELAYRDINTGHWVHAEDPEGLIKIITKWWLDVNEKEKKTS